MPQLDDFRGFSGLLTYVRGLEDSHEAIIAGQDIKKGNLERTDDNVQFAVGTTSLDLQSDVLGPPVIGHIIERAVVRRLKESGVKLPDNPKDSILHPQSEMLKLRYAKGQESPLISVFTQPDLRWSSLEKFENFASKYRSNHQDSINITS